MSSSPIPSERREGARTAGAEDGSAVPDLVAAADEPLAALCDAVIERLRPQGLQDDVALVAIRLHPEDRPRPTEAGPEQLPPGFHFGA